MATKTKEKAIEGFGIEGMTEEGNGFLDEGEEEEGALEVPEPEEEDDSTPLVNVEEAAREIRTGKRIVELPDGGKVVLRLPTVREQDAANQQMQLAKFRLKKEGFKFMTELVELTKEEMPRSDVEKILAMLRDPKKDWMEKIQTCSEFLRGSAYGQLADSTIDSLCFAEYTHYIFSHCVETIDGRNYWDTTEFGSYDRHPDNHTLRFLLTEYWRFHRDAQSPFEPAA